MRREDRAETPAVGLVTGETEAPFVEVLLDLGKKSTFGRRSHRQENGSLAGKILTFQIADLLAAFPREVEAQEEEFSNSVSLFKQVSAMNHVPSLPDFEPHSVWAESAGSR